MKTPEVPLRGFCFVGRLTTISFLADISIAHNTARIKYSRFAAVVFHGQTIYFV